MSELVDRVANAIAEAADLDSDTMYADMARAAIKAMREPTNAMLEPFEEHSSLFKGWRAAIDVALGKVDA